MTGDEGSKVQNKLDRETNNQLIKKKNSYVWGIMLLRSLASGDRYLWSHQSRGATKAWFSLLPNCSLALDGVRNWDIEALSGDNLFLSIVECVTCHLRRDFSEKLHWSLSMSHFYTNPGFSTQFGPEKFLPFLTTVSGLRSLQFASLSDFLNVSLGPI